MSELLSTDDIDLERLRRIDTVCVAFEKQWRAGRRPAAEECLSSVEDEARPELLRELLKVELHYRRKRGETPTADEYRTRFPEHAGVVAAHFPAAASTVTLPATTDGTTEPAPDGPPLPNVQGYEILGVLGRGGMGVVYKARHLRLNRLVALKMILGGAHAGPGQLARIATEGESNARLRHAHVVQIHDSGDADGLPYLALEFVEGGSLAQKLARDGRFAPRDAAAMVRKLAAAVSAAHDKKILHRDLKPANVLLDAAGEPKVADFGLAKMLDAADGRAADGPTVSGSVNGTPTYMAPEQARGDAKGTREPGVDVYALGVILFELLTGRVPFTDSSTFALLQKVQRGQPPSPRSLCRDVPRDLERVCLMCLEKNPAERYPSAAALAEDLSLYHEGKPLKYARPLGPFGRVVKWCRRNPIAAGLSALTCLSAVAFFAVFLLLPDDSLRRVQRSGTLVVGLDPNCPPYASWDGGKRVGLDVDLAHAVAARLGATVEHVELYWDWDGMVKQLDDRKVDVLISCVTITDDRKQQVAFVAYDSDPLVFAANAATPISTRDDLRDKVIAVQQDTSAHRAAERLHREGVPLTIVTRKSTPEPFDLLRSGKAQVVLEHGRIARHHTAGEPNLTIYQPDGIDPSLADQKLGIALRRDAKELRAAIESAIEEMKRNGALNDILNKWEPPR